LQCKPNASVKLRGSAASKPRRVPYRAGFSNTLHDGAGIVGRVLVRYNDGVKVSQTSIVGEPVTNKDLRRGTGRGLQECQKNVLRADKGISSLLRLTAGFLDQPSFAIGKWEHHFLPSRPTWLAQGDLELVANTIQRNARMLKHRYRGILAFTQKA
jgi:hypothetical protein